MIDELELEECKDALATLLQTNLLSLTRLFTEFHEMMKKAHEEGATPPPVPQDRANHILDLMVALYPHIELLKSEFPAYQPTITWLEENCKRIFKTAAEAN